MREGKTASINYCYSSYTYILLFLLGHLFIPFNEDGYVIGRCKNRILAE